MTTHPKIIAFQGSPGAYSDLACRSVYPDLESLACPSFEDAFAAVRDGKADLCMIPIENSVAGRVADIHHLLPHSKLSIIGEHYQPINHHLLAPKGASLDSIKTVHSHIHALSQCRDFIRTHKLKAHSHANTASAAAEIAQSGDVTRCVIASKLAGQINDLVSLAENIEDAAHNTTRFLIMSKQAQIPPPDVGPVITSLMFHVRSVPAALYKALGGFATCGINLTKLESYLVGGDFNAAQFYVDALGHPDDINMQHAMDELSFFAKEIIMMGTYPAHEFRNRTNNNN